jgi:transcriptional regulator with XRE-family HTH domain
MRNTKASQGGNWAAYAKAAREAAHLSQSEFARRIGVDRVTVYRWETGRQKPEDGDMVRRFAEVAGTPLDESLSAAGLRPDDTRIPRTPTRDPALDPDILVILRRLADPDTPEAEKVAIRGTLRYLAELANQSRRRN